MKIQILLSTKNKSGLKEVLLKAQTSIMGRRLSMNAKTGIRIPERQYVLKASRNVNTGTVKGMAGELRKPTDRPNATPEYLAYARSYNELMAMVAYLDGEYARADKATVTRHWLADAVHAYRFGAASGNTPAFDVHVSAFLRHLDDARTADGTKKNYAVLFGTIRRYVAFVNDTQKDRRGFSFDVDALTADDVTDFRDYLRNEHSLAMEFPKAGAFAGMRFRAKGENTVVRFMRQLRTFLNWLRKTGRTVNDPFAGMDNWATQTYGTPIHLTVEEVYQLAAAAMPNAALERQRDAFVLQCHLGCRFSDLAALTGDNISDGLLTYVPIKTRKHGTTARVGIDPDAAALIGKYEGNKNGTLVPCTRLTPYERAIRMALAAAGIDRKVPFRNPVTGETEYKPICEVATSHVARKTFIANYANEGVDLTVIKAMSGHKQDGSSIWRYTGVSDERIKGACKQAWEAWQERMAAREDDPTA